MNLSRTRRAAPVTASVLAVLALGLAACSDDDDDAAGTTTAASEASTTADGEGSEDTESTEDTETTEDTADTEDTTDDTDGTDATDGTEDTTGGTAGGPATEDDYVAAAAGAIGFADADMSECLAQALVDGIGMDRIEASGLSPEEFVAATSLAEVDLAVEADAAAGVQEAMTECGELVDVYLDTLDITEAEADCASAALTNELLAEWLVTRISELPSSAELDAAVEAVDACDAE